MSNELNADHKSETIAEPEPTKPSKLKRIKSNVITAGLYGVPAVMFGGMMYFGVKMSKMDLETAKLNLETAKLQDLADAATEQ